MEIKKIIACADVHIRNYIRQDEYADLLTNFINQCHEICNGLKKEEVRIVICGDMLHQKNNISPDLITIVSTFIRELENIGIVLVIAGNHDLVENNLSKKDAISSIFDTAQFQNAHLLDAILGYKSGYVIDNNITWSLYSIYDNYAKPDIPSAKKDAENNKIIGLYHGMLIGAQLNNGTIVDNGLEGDVFDGCDIVLAGDIHKRQKIMRHGIEIIYSGSLIQQNYGETVTQHGFTVIDVPTLESKFVDLVSSYGMYKIEIKDIDDIKNNKEIIINY